MYSAALFFASCVATSIPFQDIQDSTMEQLSQKEVKSRAFWSRIGKPLINVNINNQDLTMLEYFHRLELTSTNFVSKPNTAGRIQVCPNYNEECCSENPSTGRVKCERHCCGQGGYYEDVPDKSFKCSGEPFLKCLESAGGVALGLCAVSGVETLGIGCVGSIFSAGAGAIGCLWEHCQYA